MTPERFQKVDQLLSLALEVTASERAEFIRKACGSDEELRIEVESLLASHETEDDFLAEPPSQLAAQLLADSAQDRVSVESAINELAPGRYKILEKLGVGGMGVVYAAYDPELGRKVAIKLMHPQASGTISPSEGRARLLREAQAMAQLPHPNVIAVHDVGTVGDQVFIAMEYVEGSTLSHWLAEKKRDWREVLNVFVQAGRGLAAAHAAGILHRDFKPDNVLISNDGRVRVLDFGLARAAHSAIGSGPEMRADDASVTTRVSPAAAMLGVAVTEPGKLMGTPAYMAPEQLTGQLGDARTDQFSFCVALYQGLYGEVPFSGETVGALLHQMEQKRVNQPAESVRVPARLRKVLLRGLSPARDDRYESMDQLLDELTRRPPAIGRWSFGALAVLTVVTAPFAIQRVEREKPAAQQLQSIVVLPLENLSRDPGQQYLADGMTDELITNLSKVGSLRVIARSSAMRYKSRPRAIPAIARELKVDAVLEGAVLQSGDRLRITATLIDASTQKNLWADSYEESLSDVLALQNRIARAIIAGIRVKLGPPEDQRLARAQPVNSEAYLAYLRGMFYYQKGYGKEDSDAAIAEFERATTLNPDYALAHARLALAHAYVYGRYDASPERAAKASVAVQRSLSLAPSLAEAYVARGQVAGQILGSPLESLIQDYQRAVALNPNLVEAHFHVGTVYLHMCLFDEALPEYKAVLALDPHSIRARYYIARIRLQQQRYDEAFLDYERNPDFPPALQWEKVLILFYRGEKAAAQELIGELRRKEPDNEDMASTYAVLLAAEGEKDKAEDQIRLAIRVGQGRFHFHHAEYNIASAYALMGNRRSALQWLRKTAEDRLACYPLFERDPNLNNLRTDPDFQKFLGEMKSLWERRRVGL